MKRGQIPIDDSYSLCSIRALFKHIDLMVIMRTKLRIDKTSAIPGQKIGKHRIQNNTA